MAVLPIGFSESVKAQFTDEMAINELSGLSIGDVISLVFSKEMAELIKANSVPACRPTEAYAKWSLTDKFSRNRIINHELAEFLIWHNFAFVATPQGPEYWHLFADVIFREPIVSWKGYGIDKDAWKNEKGSFNIELMHKSQERLTSAVTGLLLAGYSQAQEDIQSIMKKSLIELYDIRQWLAEYNPDEMMRVGWWKDFVDILTRNLQECQDGYINKLKKAEANGGDVAGSFGSSSGGQEEGGTRQGTSGDSLRVIFG